MGYVYSALLGDLCTLIAALLGMKENQHHFFFALLGFISRICVIKLGSRERTVPLFFGGRLESQGRTLLATEPGIGVTTCTYAPDWANTVTLTVYTSF